MRRSLLALVLTAWASSTWAQGVVFKNPNDSSINTTPPTVTVSSPTSGPTYDAGAASTLSNMSGTSSSAAGIAICRWSNSLGGAGTANTSGNGDWLIPGILLTVGSNVITVSCMSAFNVAGTAVLTVTRSASGLTCSTTTASLVQSVVQTAVNAASTGQVVCLPAGTATWSGTLTINGAITLAGATPCTLDSGGRPIAGGCTTKILIGSSTSALVYNLVADLPSRLSSLWFADGGGDCGSDGCIRINGSLADARTMRIDHLVLDHLPGEHFRTYAVNGVYDHNRCTFSAVAAPFHRCGTSYGTLLGGGGGDWGGIAWTAATTLGTAACFYLEDNYASKDDPGTTHYAMWDGFAGGCYSARFNELHRLWIEAHGTDSSFQYRGTRSLEVIANTFESSSCTSTCNPIINARSAHVIAAWNRVSGAGYSGTTLMWLVAYRINSSFPVWLQADGSRAWDRNLTGALVFPVDMPCRGAGSRITYDGGGNPIVPWSSGLNDQAREQCYEWDNIKGASTNINFDPSTYGAYIVSGADYYNDVTQGTTLPATCTVGQGYFKTNEGSWNAGTNANYTGQGRLYQCTATNVWTLYYTPFTYPNPLVS